MISTLEKQFLVQKHKNQGMTIKEINQYFEKFRLELKKSKEKNQKDKELQKVIEDTFKINFKKLV
jgi:DNA-binding transcriptional MerR regulator